MKQIFISILKYLGMIGIIVGQCAMIALACTITYDYLIQGVFPNLIDIPFKGWLGLSGGLITIRYFILSYLSFKSETAKTEQLYSPKAFASILTVFLNEITYILALFIIAGIINFI